MYRPNFHSLQQVSKSAQQRTPGRLVYAREAGTVKEMDARHIVIKNAKGKG
jgi:hypothetical protein